MAGQELSLAQASLKMVLWHVEAEPMTSSVFAQLQDSGLPDEVSSRLHELITYTKKIAGKVIAV